jgi:hypothetical protein
MSKSRRSSPICRGVGKSPTPAIPTTKEVLIPTPITIIAQPPPPSPTSSVPPNPANSPLGRYLLHPGQETSELVHHVLHVLDQIGHVVLPGAVVLAVLLVGWKVVQLLSRFRPSANGHLLEVRLPATVDPKRAPVFWRNIHSVLAGPHRLRTPPPYVNFEIDSSSNGTSLRFYVSPGVPPMSVARAISSAWPGAQCQHHQATPLSLAGRLVACGELCVAGPAWRSLWADQTADPLRSVLGAMEVHHDGERAIVQVLARPASSHQRHALARATRALHAGKPTALVPRLLAAWRTTTPPPRPDPIRSAEVRRAVDKVSDLPVFDVVVRYGVSAEVADRASRRRLRARARELTAAFGVYSGDNHFVHRRRLGCRRHLERRVIGHGQLLGLSELAALAHLPHGEATPGLSYAGAAAVAPPSGVVVGPWRQGGEEDDDDWL